MAFTSENVAVFLAVLEHGSFSGAARALGRVPSAVSMTIAHLEAELDLVLFERSTREVRPTEAALALEPEARQLIGQLRRLQAQALSLHQGLERRLTLAVASELLAAPWSQLLARLAQEFPTLEVEVLSAPQADVLNLLHDQVADLAIIFERIGVDERESFLGFAREILIAVVAPQHSIIRERRGRVSLNDLIELRQIAVASRRTRNSDPRLEISRRIWRTDSHLATLSLVQAGLGWAYLPRKLVEPLVASGALVAISFENISNQFPLWVDVVWLKHRALGLGAQRFIQWVQESAGGLSEAD